jgi:hypothetical protein
MNLLIFLVYILKRIGKRSFANNQLQIWLGIMDINVIYVTYMYLQF